jgi:hypothetical protein
MQVLALEREHTAVHGVKQRLFVGLKNDSGEQLGPFSLAVLWNES